MSGLVPVMGLSGVRNTRANELISSREQGIRPIKAGAAVITLGQISGCI